MPIFADAGLDSALFDLADRQWELDGYRFNGPADLATIVAGGVVYTPGEIRQQDQVDPRGESAWFGRDYASPGEREFSLIVTDRYYHTDIRPTMAELAAAWRPAYVHTPGRAGLLRWRDGDKVYREYGRPRGLTVAPLPMTQVTHRLVTAHWQSRDSLAFEDAEQSISLDLVDESGSTGLLFPAPFPWSFGTATQSQRSSIAYVESPTATPMRIVVRGPQVGTATNLRLWAPGWELDFGTLALASGEVLTVDTLDRTAMVGSRSVAGSLQRGSSLSALLEPGSTEFHFTASDLSATTTASVYWRNTAPIF